MKVNWSITGFIPGEHDAHGSQQRSPNSKPGVGHEMIPRLGLMP